MSKRKWQSQVEQLENPEAWFERKMEHRARELRNQVVPLSAAELNAVPITVLPAGRAYYSFSKTQNTALISKRQASEAIRKKRRQ